MATMRDATLVTFGTEVLLLQRAGMSSGVCGPDAIKQAHQADVFASLAQLGRCEVFLCAHASSARQAARRREDLS